MTWNDDLPADWERATDHPPVSADAVDPLHLGVGVRDLVVDLDDHR